MNTGFDPDARVIIVNSWERNHTVSSELQNNMRLVKEERVTTRKVQLVFKPIVFQDWPPTDGNLDRYWEVRRDLNKIATDRNAKDRNDECAAEAADCLTDKD